MEEVVAPLALCSVSALSWLFLLYIWASQTSAIRLTDDSDEDDELDKDVPIEIERWERRIKRNKMAFGMVTLIGIAANIANLATTDVLSWTSILWLTFWVNMLLWSAVWYTQNSVKAHWRVTVLVSTLSLLSVCESVSSAILRPRSSSSDQLLHQVLPGTILLICLILACNTPSAPPKLVVSPFTYTSEKATVSSENEASIWSTLSFGYVTSIMKPAPSADGEKANIPPLGDADRTFGLYRVWKRSCEASLSTRTDQRSGTEVFGRCPSRFNRLEWRVFVTNRTYILGTASAEAVLAVSRLVPAWATKHFLDHLQNASTKGASKRPACFWLLVLVVSGLAKSIIQNQVYHIWKCPAQGRMKSQLHALLYEKTLKRREVASRPADGPESGPEQGSEAKAHIMNLFSTDLVRAAETYNRLAELLISHPFIIAFGAYLLYDGLGLSGFFGLVLPFALTPLTRYLLGSLKDSQKSLNQATDRRVAITNEVLNSIRFIKFQAHEKAYHKRIMDAREIELRALKNNQNLHVYIDALSVLAPLLSLFVAFACYTKVEKKVLTASVAFSATMILEQLRLSLKNLTSSTFAVIQGRMSFERLEGYLAADDKLSSTMTILPNINRGAEPLQAGEAQAVILRNATFSWPGSQEGGDTPGFQLNGLTAEFCAGLNLVCGAFGSGKSMMLKGLLGEVDLISGECVLDRSDAADSVYGASAIPCEMWLQAGKCAYAPQSAWLLNGSIRDNILFGLPLQEPRYTSTLEACALLPDLAIFEDGDLTEIGEKGVILSGGQKARVSLARAIYSRATTVLLDDVLSAVDAHTAKHITEECLSGQLAEERIIILVTHHVQLLASLAVQAVHLEGGTSVFAGTGHSYLETEFYQSATRHSDPDEEHINEDGTEHSEPLATPSTAVWSPSSSTSFNTAVGTPAVSKDKRAVVKQLIVKENKIEGGIGRTVWAYWAKANGGTVFWIMVLAVFFAGKGAYLVRDGWIGTWTDYNTQHTDPADANNFYLGILAVTSLGALLPSIATRGLPWQSKGVTSSVQGYAACSITISNALLRDSTHRGRLLNRFGRDTEVIDVELSEASGQLATGSSGYVMVLITICLVSPYFAAAIIPLTLIYTYYGRLYMTVAREMRRMDALMKSPLYSLYSETISGAPVIRAYGASPRFMLQCLQRVDQSQLYYYMTWQLNRWLSVRFDFVSMSVTATAGAFLLLLPPSIATPGLAGFVINATAKSSQEIFWLTRHWTTAEVAMISVERCKEYIELPSEAPEVIEPRPAASWPARGDVEVRGLCMRYAQDLPRVVNDVSFSIKAGQKIGVVGATGSGKTTLSLAFFRFMEADAGRILIDGLDIAKIGLFDLRSRLTVVPQDPTILSGTLRSSLDPLEEGHTDQEMYTALKRVHLLDCEGSSTDTVSYNQSFFRNLDNEISEQGKNLSAGEKQLLCLARAILKNNKFVILDEATSSIDYQTDRLVNETIAEEFKDSTMLVIAHRLRSVITFDKILVMDKGRVAEFDSPKKLMADPDSRFHAFCEATGAREFSTLRSLCYGSSAFA